MLNLFVYEKDKGFQRSEDLSTISDIIADPSSLLGLMVVISLGLLCYFKRIKWL
jgi:hypothetical protein